MTMSHPTRCRILFIIPTLHGGGSERVLVNLLRHLDRTQFEACLVIVDMRDAAYQEDIPADIEIVNLGHCRIRYAIPAIIRMIWKRRPDVVFSTLGHLNLTLGMLRPFLPHNVRFFARETVVVSELLRQLRFGWLWAVGYQVFYSRFDRIICQSSDMVSDLVGRFGIQKDRIVMIRNPLDIVRVRALAALPAEPAVAGPTMAGEGVIRIIAAGRLTHQKGFDMLIDAIARCANPRLRLTLMGDGPLRHVLEQQAQDCGIDKQIRFIGFQSNPYPFFAQADAFVLSSRFEGLPNVVLEAMACGTPVIATPAPGGVREILEGIAGCRIARRIDSQALAEALEDVVPGRRLSDDVANKYDVGVVTGLYQQLFLTGSVH